MKDVDALNALHHLLSIKCEFNKLRSAALVERPYLQVKMMVMMLIMVVVVIVIVVMD